MLTGWWGWERSVGERGTVAGRGIMLGHRRHRGMEEQEEEEEEDVGSLGGRTLEVARDVGGGGGRGHYLTHGEEDSGRHV